MMPNATFQDAARWNRCGPSWTRWTARGRAASALMGEAVRRGGCEARRPRSGASRLFGVRQPSHGQRPVAGAIKAGGVELDPPKRGRMATDEVARLSGLTESR